MLSSAAPHAEADAERPPWHWSAIGAVSVFLVWGPLAMLAEAIGARLVGSAFDASDPASVAAHLASAAPLERSRFWIAVIGLPASSFVVAAALGGALVATFGGKAGLREATVAGVAAAVIVWALAAVRVGLVGSLATLVVVALLGAASAWAGAAIALRVRARPRVARH